VPTAPQPARVPEGQDFFAAWHALDAAEQKRIRRLVRIGRPVEPDEAPLAVAYARFQRRRAWQRFFWVWFVPGLLVALGVALTIHPIVVGIVLASAAQAAMAHVNLGRAERVNRGGLRAAT
jgi:hypothetical protein